VADLQPTLTGETVELRPTVPNDWPELFAIASDREIWAVHPAHDRWQEPVFRRYFEDALASGGSLTIRERATGRVIGASRYRPDPQAPDICEIGWTFLARDHWGLGTNREMKALMIRHALRSFGTTAFMVGENNFRSRRAMEKIGGVLSDRTQITKLSDGPVVHVIYEIGRDAMIAKA
jgi:RimJ/RimL family protein N-acetyltransferase